MRQLTRVRAVADLYTNLLNKHNLEADGFMFNAIDCRFHELNRFRLVGNCDQQRRCGSGISLHVHCFQRRRWHQPIIFVVKDLLAKRLVPYR
jgi:hypothetical protein